MARVGTSAGRDPCRSCSPDARGSDRAATQPPGRGLRAGRIRAADVDPVRASPSDRALATHSIDRSGDAELDRLAAKGQRNGGDGGESNSPSKTLLRRPLRACPMVCRRPPERASAPCRAVQSRAPRSGLTPDYVTLARIAASLDDASTTREEEVASTLTLLPKQRERESTGGCQVLLFAT